MQPPGAGRQVSLVKGAYAHPVRTSEGNKGMTQSVIKSAAANGQSVNGHGISSTQPNVVVGVANPWPPAVQHEVQVKIAISVLLIGLAIITTAGAFVLVPDSPTWRHFLAAGLLCVKGFPLTWMGLRLVRLTIWGKGKRRRS